MRIVVLIRIIVAFAACTALSPLRAESQSTRSVTISVSTAKLRSSASESSSTIKLLNHAEKFTMVGSKRGWVQIRTRRGNLGWLRRDLVTVGKIIPARSTTRLKDTGIRSAKTTTPKATTPKLTRHIKVSVVPLAPAPKRASAQRVVKSKPAMNTEPINPVPVVLSRMENAVADDVLPGLVRPDTSSGTDVVRVKDTIEAKRTSVVNFARSTVSSAVVSPNRSVLMSRANSLRGTPYRFGSSGGGSFDCSGFTSYIFRKVGIRLPRSAAEQFNVGTKVAGSGLRVGDLVFFRNTAGRRGISHVGIFNGKSSFIHASSGGHAVRIDSLKSGYYASHFAGGRRPIR